MANIDEISRAIGRVENGIDNLNKKFDDLPCGMHQKKIEEFDAYKNKTLGIMAVIGMIFGFLGMLISPFIDWIFNKVKWLKQLYF